MSAVEFALEGGTLEVTLTQEQLDKIVQSFQSSPDTNVSFAGHDQVIDEEFEVVFCLDQGPYLITDASGAVLARFIDEQERDEAMLTGEYPDDAEPAYQE